MTEKQAKAFLKKVKGKRIVWEFLNGKISPEIIIPTSLKKVKRSAGVDFEIISKEGLTDWNIEEGFKKNVCGRWIFVNSPTTDFILED